MDFLRAIEITLIFGAPLYIESEARLITIDTVLEDLFLHIKSDLEEHLIPIENIKSIELSR